MGGGMPFPFEKQKDTCLVTQSKSVGQSTCPLAPPVPRKRNDHFRQSS